VFTDLWTLAGKRYPWENGVVSDNPR
jgi:hypothetical protein